MSDRNEPPRPPEYDPYEDLAGLTGEEPVPPLEDPALPPATPPRSPLLTGLILGLLLVVLSIAVFNLTRDDDTAAIGDLADTTATTTETTSAGNGEPSDTTVDDGGETTDTTTTTTTTTATPADFEPYQAVGQPLPLSDLTLQTSGLGVVALGSDAAEAMGKLIATLGEPTSDTGPITSTGEYGACEGELVRIVKFGALAAIIVVDADGTETFAGYRLDLMYEDAATSIAVDMETRSGLKLGHNVGDLRRIYESLDVDIVNDGDFGRVFELRGGSGNLLLWGPVSDSGDEGTDTIIGIYSVDASENFC